MGFKFNPLTGQLDLVNKSSGSLDNRTSLVCGESISALRFVFTKTDGKAYLGNHNTTYDEANVVGISLTSGNVDETITIMMFGRLDDALFSLIPSEIYFLSTNGQFTATAPTSGHLVRVGQGLLSGSILVNIDDPIVL